MSPTGAASAETPSPPRSGFSPHAPASHPSHASHGSSGRTPDDLGATLPLEPTDFPAGATPMPPTQLGPFRLQKRLGRGGQASVYLAQQLNLQRPAAVKVLSFKLAADEAFVERFHREARIAARLNHPNIVSVFDSGCEQGFHWLAMELVEGESVDDLLQREKRLAPARAFQIAHETAVALHEATRHRIIHRDVKPQNVLLTTDGTAKLADLGMAKQHTVDKSLTATGMVIGTPRYMSPEMVLGDDVDVQSDIYSLGVMLYQMLTGEVPLRGESVMETLLRHTKDAVPAPSEKVSGLGRSVDQVVARMTAIDREARYGDAAELVTDLVALREGRTPPNAVSVALGNAPRRSSESRLDARGPKSSGRARAARSSRRRARSSERARAEAPGETRGTPPGVVIGAAALLGVVALVVTAAVSGWVSSSPAPAPVARAGGTPAPATDDPDPGPTTPTDAATVGGAGGAETGSTPTTTGGSGGAPEVVTPPRPTGDGVEVAAIAAEIRRLATEGKGDEVAAAFALAADTLVALPDEAAEDRATIEAAEATVVERFSAEAAHVREVGPDGRHLIRLLGVADRCHANASPSIRARLRAIAAREVSRILAITMARALAGEPAEDIRAARFGRGGAACQEGPYLENFRGLLQAYAVTRDDHDLSRVRAVFAFWTAAVTACKDARATLLAATPPEGVLPGAPLAAWGLVRLARGEALLDVPFVGCTDEELAAALELTPETDPEHAERLGLLLAVSRDVERATRWLARAREGGRTLDPTDALAAIDPRESIPEPEPAPTVAPIIEGAAEIGRLRGADDLGGALAVYRRLGRTYGEAIDRVIGELDGAVQGELVFGWLLDVAASGDLDELERPMQFLEANRALRRDAERVAELARIIHAAVAGQPLIVRDLTEGLGDPSPDVKRKPSKEAKATLDALRALLGEPLLQAVLGIAWLREFAYRSIVPLPKLVQPWEYQGIVIEEFFRSLGEQEAVRAAAARDRPGDRALLGGIEMAERRIRASHDFFFEQWWHQPPRLALDLTDPVHAAALDPRPRSAWSTRRGLGLAEDLTSKDLSGEEVGFRLSRLEFWTFIEAEVRLGAEGLALAVVDGDGKVLSTFLVGPRGVGAQKGNELGKFIKRITRRPKNANAPTRLVRISLEDSGSDPGRLNVRLTVSLFEGEDGPPVSDASARVILDPEASLWIVPARGTRVRGLFAESWPP